jgi:hypothetical protein
MGPEATQEGGVRDQRGAWRAARGKTYVAEVKINGEVKGSGRGNQQEESGTGGGGPPSGDPWKGAATRRGRQVRGRTLSAVAATGVESPEVLGGNSATTGWRFCRIGPGMAVWTRPSAACDSGAGLPLAVPLLLIPPWPSSPNSLGSGARPRGERHRHQQPCERPPTVLVPEPDHRHRAQSTPNAISRK